MTLGTISHNTN